MVAWRNKAAADMNMEIEMTAPITEEGVTQTTLNGVNMMGEAAKLAAQAIVDLERTKPTVKEAKAAFRREEDGQR